MGLAFQGFYERDRGMLLSGTEECYRIPTPIVNARTDPKASSARLEELPGLLPLANFGPA